MSPSPHNFLLAQSLGEHTHYLGLPALLDDGQAILQWAPPRRGRDAKRLAAGVRRQRWG